MTPTSVILWTGTTLFVATAVIAVLALIGRVTLGGGDGSGHHEYMKWLFGILIAEVVSASVVAFESRTALRGRSGRIRARKRLGTSRNRDRSA